MTEHARHGIESHACSEQIARVKSMALMLLCFMKVSKCALQSSFLLTSLLCLGCRQHERATFWGQLWKC